MSEFNRAGMQLAPHYSPPAVPIPKNCDQCEKPCTSECMCGEVFCSRACMLVDWKKGHRQLCETVVENTSIVGAFAAWHVIVAALWGLLVRW